MPKRGSASASSRSRWDSCFSCPPAPSPGGERGGCSGVFFGASIPIPIYLMRHDPALLQRRLAAGPTAEKEPAQKIIMLMASLGFIATLVVPALDYRYSWSSTPQSVVLLGDALAMLCFGITFLVYKEN